MPSIWKKLLIRLTVCSLCSMYICIFVVSHFGFEDETVVLIAPALGQCLP